MAGGQRVMKGGEQWSGLLSKLPLLAASEASARYVLLIIVTRASGTGPDPSCWMSGDLEHLQT